MVVGSQEPRLKITGTRPGRAGASGNSRRNLIARIDLPEPARPRTTSRPDRIRP